MSERLNKTSICSIIFLDIISYSQEPVAEQIAFKERFNALIAEALKGVAQNDRIILDTGDGAAITLMGAPEEALFIALTIRDSILANNAVHADKPLKVRIGINLGPVRVVRDINNHLNVIGDGINVAQRVMSFSEPNQILASRSYYEIVSRLSNEITQMFSYSGLKQDKHVREHEVYVISTPSDGSGTNADTPENTVAEAKVAASPAPTMMASRRNIAVAAMLLAVVVGTVFVLRGKTQQSPLPAPITASPSQPAADKPPSTDVDKPQPEKKVASKTGEKNKVSSKKATAAQGMRKSEQSHNNAEHETPAADPHAKENTADKHAEHAQPSQEKKPDTQKSGLDKFVDSVKQGSDKPTCTDSQRALMGCR